jgi:hypothetical protein
MIYYNLEEEFTEEEVKAVINDIAADKAPGPDGYIGVFFEKKLASDQGWDRSTSGEG